MLRTSSVRYVVIATVAVLGVGCGQQEPAVDVGAGPAVPGTGFGQGQPVLPGDERGAGAVALCDSAEMLEIAGMGEGTATGLAAVFETTAGAVVDWDVRRAGGEAQRQVSHWASKPTGMLAAVCYYDGHWAARGPAVHGPDGEVVEREPYDMTVVVVTDDGDHRPWAHLRDGRSRAPEAPEGARRLEPSPL